MKDRVKVLVKARAKRSEIVKYDTERKAYIVNIKAPPEDGKANLELIKLFKKMFKKNVKIIKGLKNKEKLLLIDEF